MDDLGPRVNALLERAAAGAIGEPPVDEILTHGARRRRTRTAVITATAAVATAAVVSTVALITTGTATRDQQPIGPRPPTAAPRPVPTTGVSARALAHGRWINVPRAPITFCGQTSVVWTGSVVVAVTGEDSVTCASAAASYDPKANHWSRLSAPPPGINGQLMLVSSGDRVVAVSQLRGATAALDPATGKWQALADLPVRPADPGTQPVATAIAARGDVVVVGAGHGSDQAFRLPAGQTRWTDLARLPHAKDQHVVATSGYNDGAATWVTMATEHSEFDSQTQTTTTDSTHSVVELRGSAWIEHGAVGLPMLVRSADALGPGALVVGGNCLPGMSCPYAPPAIVRADFRAGLSQQLPVSPLGGTTQEAFSTGAAVLVYDASGAEGGPNGSVEPGATAVYDLDAARWLKAPHSVRVQNIAGQVWTSYGFVVLGQPMEKCVCITDGLILRPGRS